MTICTQRQALYQTEKLTSFTTANRPRVSIHLGQMVWPYVVESQHYWPQGLTSWHGRPCRKEPLS